MNEKFEEFSEEKKQLHNTIDDLQVFSNIYLFSSWNIHENF